MAKEKISREILRYFEQNEDENDLSKICEMH